MSKYLSLLQKIHIHPLLWVMIAISIVTANFKPLFFLMIIIFVHEMGHAISAHFFSWRIKNIMLLPFGGVAEVDEHGNRSLKEEFIVVLAGPIQHLWLQGAAFLLFFFGFVNPDDYQLFSFYNMTILLFNLLPIWPLDGGKLLFILFSNFWSYQKAHFHMMISSLIFLGLYVSSTILFSPTHLNMWIITTFLIYSLYHEHKNRMYSCLRFLMERYYGKQASINHIKPIVVEENEFIYDVLLQFQRGCKHLIIVERDGVKISQMDENELLHAYFADKLTDSKIGDLVYAY
ncbi:M50 family metallopeptidase [Metabacillus litoralis]|uniref:M50 family metallopeptidase n=1 Tax=Metabacillus TaxID=2675233 RepID=UPI000EF568A5|nr:M50 family metallopeptidase [Metabacillus litoralis]MCM3165021.1 M50 family metallopeptidase [Metabacillus litoralis]MCM3413116.1 M50 family metallopeptidase [Metabacillus litoralis]UHA62344.1 M50 family metallopeptidase [Metabacillus litoralis]